MFQRILIANRGEIAIRIIRSCREMGIRTVAVYSEADAAAPHVIAADEAVCIGPAPSAESYLDIERVVAAARCTAADAVHPGYGFLAESADFARAVQDAGLTFIGPSANAIAAMGDKMQARSTVAAAGVPVAPAVEAPSADSQQLAACAQRVGYPLLIKPVAGGGGKGMRLVRAAPDLCDAFAAAAREAASAFGDARLFFERYLERPRHVEVQVLGDAAGNIIHLGERECSVQRRHQKVIEETPSPAVGAALRERLTATAIQVARCVRYQGAGTVEFLLDTDGKFYFLEMNTRLQVEHPITELVTGVDLVCAQLRAAAGEPLRLSQEDVVPRGHAIECRVCAEDPTQQFLPSPGRILYMHEPQGPGVRVDSGIAPGFEVSPHYDSLLSKVSVLAETREAARRRMITALAEYVVLGCTTGISFLLDVLEHPAFRSGDTHTHFIPDYFSRWSGRQHHKLVATIAAALDAARPDEAPSAQSATRRQASPWATLGNWRIGRP
ncbi:MAG: acetyl/propionyl/methylcrotonyl-CoA carboxylase subunit alpha [Candidatus Binatia bacterium]